MGADGRSQFAQRIHEQSKGQHAITVLSIKSYRTINRGLCSVPQQRTIGSCTTNATSGGIFPISYQSGASASVEPVPNGALNVLRPPTRCRKPRIYTLSCGLPTTICPRRATDWYSIIRLFERDSSNDPRASSSEYGKSDDAIWPAASLHVPGPRLGLSIAYFESTPIWESVVRRAFALQCIRAEHAICSRQSVIHQQAGAITRERAQRKAVTIAGLSQIKEETFDSMREQWRVPCLDLASQRGISPESCRDVYYKDQKCDNFKEKEHCSLLRDLWRSSMATELVASAWDHERWSQPAGGRGLGFAFHRRSFLA